MFHFKAEFCFYFIFLVSNTERLGEGISLDLLLSDSSHPPMVVFEPGMYCTRGSGSIHWTVSIKLVANVLNSYFNITLQNKVNIAPRRWFWIVLSLIWCFVGFKLDNEVDFWLVSDQLTLGYFEILLEDDKRLRSCW